MVTQNEERTRVIQYIKSIFGIPLNNGWILSNARRTWTQAGVPISRIVGLWSYRRERMLRLRQFYEKKVRHRTRRYYLLPTTSLRKGNILVGRTTNTSIDLEYHWLVLMENNLMPLADALRVAGEG